MLLATSPFISANDSTHDYEWSASAKTQGFMGIPETTGLYFSCREGLSVELGDSRKILVYKGLDFSVDSGAVIHTRVARRSSTLYTVTSGEKEILGQLSEGRVVVVTAYLMSNVSKNAKPDGRITVAFRLTGLSKVIQNCKRK